MKHMISIRRSKQDLVNASKIHFQRIRIYYTKNEFLKRSFFVKSWRFWLVLVISCVLLCSNSPKPRRNLVKLLVSGREKTYCFREDSLVV
jgi:hypothetical protein